MRRTLGVIIAGVLTFSSGAAAAQSQRQVGPWTLYEQRDRFGSGASVFAATLSRGMMFAVRCISGEFSLGLMSTSNVPGRYSEGTQLLAKVRIDENPIEEPDARSVNDRLVQIELDPAKAAQLLTGREVAIQLEFRGSISTHVIPLRRSREALTPVFDACSVPKS